MPKEGFKDEQEIRFWMSTKICQNSGFKPVLAETEIKECFGRNYLNFRAFILQLLSGEPVAFGKTENVQVVSRTKTAYFVKMAQKSQEISES